MVELADVAVVGGGIAGVSVAHALAEAGSDVVLLEAEPVLAHHTTGRSAAILVDSLGTPPTWPLTAASRDWLLAPPPGLVEHDLLTPRGVLTIATAADADRLDEIEEESRRAHTPVSRLDAGQARELVPLLADVVVGAVWEPEPSDIDVAGLHQAFVRGLRRAGGRIVVGARVAAIARHGARWRLDTAAGEAVDVGHVVDAAGAWADEVAVMAGARPVGLRPLRRTAFTVPCAAAAAAWPMVHTADGGCYFRPEGAGLLCSLADETPDRAHDVRPHDVDVAMAIERINGLTDLAIRHVERAWAGLRTFAADRTMVIGPDPDVDGFTWLAGQGGTGIQTAPAAARLAAAHVLGADPSQVVPGADPAAYLPARLHSGPRA